MLHCADSRQMEFSAGTIAEKERLPQLPAPWIAPTVEAGYHDNPIVLDLEECAIWEAPDSRPPTVPVDDRELHWLFRNCLNRGLDRERESFPKLRADVVIPFPRFLQILIRFWNPDDRECHGFLNRPALTCSQGMTSEGFCSCRAIR
jgi:hypothetical protein